MPEAGIREAARMRITSPQPRQPPRPSRRPVNNHTRHHQGRITPPALRGRGGGCRGGTGPGGTARGADGAAATLGRGGGAGIAPGRTPESSQFPIGRDGATGLGSGRICVARGRSAASDPRKSPTDALERAATTGGIVGVLAAAPAACCGEVGRRLGINKAERAADPDRATSFTRPITPANHPGCGG